MTRKKRENVVAAFQASGLSQAEFCRREGVASSVLQYHLKKAPAQSHGFVPVGRPSAIEIQAPSGMVIRVPVDVDAAVIAKVLEAARAFS